MSEETKESTTVTITVDLKDVAVPVKAYYETMQEGMSKHPATHTNTHARRTYV